MRDHTVQLEEDQRQLVLVALAKLSIERPGWLDAIESIALKMDNRTAQGEPVLLSAFRRIHGAGERSRKVKSTVRDEARKELTAMMVRALYASYDTAMLEEILAVGRQYEAGSDREEVLYLNEALASEIEQRKASR